MAKPHQDYAEQSTRAVNLAGKMFKAAFDLTALDEKAVVEAMRFLSTSNPELIAWLASKLNECVAASLAGTETEK